MANLSYFDCEDSLLEKVQTPADIYFAVYDSCVTNNIPSLDLAFIEQRNSTAFFDPSGDEKYFATLTEAKIYVKNQFKSGGEYFSVNQSENPDDFLQILIDKVNYLIA